MGRSCRSCCCCCCYGRYWCRSGYDLMVSTGRRHTTVGYATYARTYTHVRARVSSGVRVHVCVRSHNLSKTLVWRRPNERELEREQRLDRLKQLLSQFGFLNIIVFDSVLKHERKHFIYFDKHQSLKPQVQVFLRVIPQIDLNQLNLLPITQNVITKPVIFDTIYSFI